MRERAVQKEEEKRVSRFSGSLVVTQQLLKFDSDIGAAADGVLVINLKKIVYKLCN